MAIVVVCHVDRDEDHAQWVGGYRRHRFHIWRRVCKALFDTDPDVFVE